MLHAMQKLLYGCFLITSYPAQSEKKSGFPQRFLSCRKSDVFLELCYEILFHALTCSNCMYLVVYVGLSSYILAETVPTCNFIRKRQAITPFCTSEPIRGAVTNLSRRCPWLSTFQNSSLPKWYRDTFQSTKYAIIYFPRGFCADF
jgi:hypothetical protein